MAEAVAEKEAPKTYEQQVKEAVEKAQKEGKPLGDYTGLPTAELTSTDEYDITAEEYVGIGPLVVHTPRGEVKAKSGDLVLKLLPKPVEGEEPGKPIFHVIPFEIIDAIVDWTPPPAPPSAYEARKKAAAEAKKSEPKHEAHKLPVPAPATTKK